MMRLKSCGVSAFALLVLIAGSAATPSYAQNFSVVYNFGTRSGEPAGPGWSGIVAQGRDGNLFTTSNGGGTDGAGTVFEVSPAGQFRVRYSFCSTGTCPGFPHGLTLGKDGNFYASSETGGSLSQGDVFKITPQGSFTELKGFSQSNNDGAFPKSPPIEGADGSFYGTAAQGGLDACGTVYRITPAGAFTLLHGFDGADGCDPFAPLVQGTDGNFYGTTTSGGTAQDGIVFRITPSGALTVLYDFDGTHGKAPFGPLAQGSDRNFYGTTTTGGASNAGLIFKVTPTGTLTVLHDLNGTTDGRLPAAGLVPATDGNFYGVNQYGGNSANCSTSGCGTLFQVTPAGSYSVLYNFDAATGDQPLVTLIQHTNGLLYGDTSAGGTGKLCQNGSVLGCGVFYSWNGNLPPFVALLPYSGEVGSTVEILGQGFTSASTVSFNGTPAAVALQGNSGTYLRAMVPSGATTGFVTVTTSTGTLTSNKQFVVTP